PGKFGSGEQLLLGDNFVPLDSIEFRSARRGFSTFGGAASGEPFRKAAVEDGDIARAEMPQHEPAASGGSCRAVVVDDHAVVAPNAEPLYPLAASLGGWPRVWEQAGT